MGDVLIRMLREQWEIEKKFRPIEASNGFFKSYASPSRDFPVSLQTPLGQAFIKDAMFRMAEELFEAANELKMRPWKQTVIETDVPRFMEELADFHHFYLRLLLMIFGSPKKAVEGLGAAYHNKAKINRQRAEDGV